MKLIFCRICGDVVKLTRAQRQCECGLIVGYVEEDGLNAVISEDALPLGIEDDSLISALGRRPMSGDGRRFEAVVLPNYCRTIWIQLRKEFMSSEQDKKEKLIQGFKEIQALIASGYAGVDQLGRIVDRRGCPGATPLQANDLLNVPEPKEIGK